jgi:hypothetical protein
MSKREFVIEFDRTVRDVLKLSAYVNDSDARNIIKVVLQHFPAHFYEAQGGESL